MDFIPFYDHDNNNVAVSQTNNTTHII